MIQSPQFSKISAPVPPEWQPFNIDSSYRYITTMVSPKASLLIAARHSSGEVCSIKKYPNLRLDISKAKICLRELKMLHHLRNHKNILCVYDMDFELNIQKQLADVYIYTELPSSNLAKLINNKKAFSRQHIQFLMYQLLCALKYIHSAGIIHGDVRPSNILVNPDTSIKISGFAYSRSHETMNTTAATIPNTSADAILYQAPEMLLGAFKASCAIDVWSAGCIFAELTNGTPIFDRKDLPGQIRTIINRLGTPPETVLSRIASPQTAKNLRDMQRQGIPPLGESIPNTNPAELEIIGKTLLWDPLRRAKAAALLDHGYFTPWRNRDEEAECGKIFPSEFEQESRQEAVNHMIMTEISHFRETVRQETLSGVRSTRQRIDYALSEGAVDVSEEDGEFEWDENVYTGTSYL